MISKERDSFELSRVADHEPFLPVTDPRPSPLNRVPSPLASASSSLPHRRKPRGGLARVGLGPKRLVALVVTLLLFMAWLTSKSDHAAVSSVSHAVASVGGKAVGWTGLSTPANPFQNVRQRPTLHSDPLRTTVCTGTDSSVRYGLVIDAGSQGSRIHVYKFNTCAQRAGQKGTMPELEDELFLAKQGGLSKYAGHPIEAAASLKELLDAALQRVPAQLHKCTPIAVKATAGLRLTGEKEAKDILDAVRHLLESHYPFPLADAPGHNAVEIMDGSEEAVYAWITVNYLLGTIGSTQVSAPTAAVLDLGGASTQIVFEPRNPQGLGRMLPGAHVYELNHLAGQDHVLYQNSYLGYGLMQVREAVHALSAFLHGLAQARNPHRSSTESMVPHHCLAYNAIKSANVSLLPSALAAAAAAVAPPNINPDQQSPAAAVREVYGAHTFQGTSYGPEACAAVVETVLDKHAPCSSGQCAFAGVYQPSLTKSLPDGAPVVALSYFYDRLAPLGLAPSFTVQQLGSLTHDVCRDPSTWAVRFPKQQYPLALQELNDRPESCLDLTYLYTLLKVGYELADSHVIITDKKIAGTELGWSLGAQLAILERSDVQCRT